MYILTIKSLDQNLSFGKYRNKTLREVITHYPDYANWMMESAEDIFASDQLSQLINSISRVRGVESRKNRIDAYLQENMEFIEQEKTAEWYKECIEDSKDLYNEIVLKQKTNQVKKEKIITKTRTKDTQKEFSELITALNAAIFDDTLIHQTKNNKLCWSRIETYNVGVKKKSYKKPPKEWSNIYFRRIYLSKQKAICTKSS